MAGIREDYIERMIERLVAALAAILKAGKSQKTEEALDLVHQTSLSLFGMEYRMLITIDAGSVAGLLEHPAEMGGMPRSGAQLRRRCRAAPLPGSRSL